ncbi:MAG: hypothetical protein V1662_00880 [Candidatus Omnitrophota bacterium]
MKRAIVYVVALGIICLGAGIGAGMIIEKNNTNKNLPRIMRSCMLQRRPGGEFSKMREPGRWQEKGKVRAGANGVFGYMGKELNLSEQQQGQVKEILEQTKQKVTLARDEFNTKTMQAKEESNAQIMAILTSEQQEKYKKIMAQMEERKANKKGEMGRRREHGECIPQH